MSNQLNDQSETQRKDQAAILLPARMSIPAPGVPASVLRLVAPARGQRGSALPESALPERELASVFGPLLLRALAPADTAAHAAFLLALGERGQRMRRFALPRADGAQAAGPAALGMVLVDRPEAGQACEVLGELVVCIDRKRIAAEFAIAVRPARRGCGLGRMLMTVLLDICRARRVTLVCASVPSGSPAMLALARACGFQVLRAADGTAQLALMLRPRGLR